MVQVAFSKTWKSSSQPRKQRKYVYNAPLHVRGTFLHAPLSKELRAKHKIPTLRVRKGDKVKVLRGQFKGHVGQVDKVFVKEARIVVQKAELQKKDGSSVRYPIHPSNVQILELKDEKKRMSKKTGGK
ncbi:MAG: 50S ribosomal protein L24 [Candidatus Woesearchaeota archaeon]